LRSALKQFNLGVCLDTAHIFASGYDLCGHAAINRTITEFDKKIGLQNLKLIHLNDSASPMGSKKDRHADIGTGHIGKKNLCLILNHPKLKNIPMILETPGGEMVRYKDILLLKSMRK
jgi:deoxyribonuclease-4